jgi:hypothetical protein
MGAAGAVFFAYFLGGGLPSQARKRGGWRAETRSLQASKQASKSLLVLLGSRNADFKKNQPLGQSQKAQVAIKNSSASFA